MLLWRADCICVATLRHLRTNLNGKWETLRNYSIERSMGAQFVPSSNYIGNFSASEWKQTEAHVIRYIVTIKCFRISFVLTFSWLMMVNHSCRFWLSVVGSQHIHDVAIGAIEIYFRILKSDHFKISFIELIMDLLYSYCGRFKIYLYQQFSMKLFLFFSFHFSYIYPHLHHH